jgi:hypothetical protein
MGSAAMDNQGNIAVGYSVSSLATFPSIRYAGRLASDPANGLFQGEATLVAGSGVQRGTANRWGDYSQLSVDPSDDCTFWYTTEYYTAASQAFSIIGWLTQIGTFKFTGCTAPLVGTLNGHVQDSVSSAAIAGALVSVGSGLSTYTDASGNYSIVVPAASYTVTVSKSGYFSGSQSATITNGGTTTKNFSLVLNTPPTISSIPNAKTKKNTPVTVNFTVGDTESGAGAVTVSGVSSNTTLVPNVNLVFGGSGASRTLTVTPATNQIGTTKITVTASDGSLTASTTFAVVVGARGLRDMNADGLADIAWRNASSGQNIGWLMNGTTLLWSAFFGDVSDLNWEMRAVRDFNGDGKADILWRNKATGDLLVWFLDGPGLAGWGFIGTVSDTNWDIAGVGDFNGDGKADILWRNKATGDDVIWLMNGATLLEAAFEPSITDQNWEVKGVDDYNGDFTADIFWHNKATGENVVWLMQGFNIPSFGFLSTISDTNWEPKGVGDLNGDGRADIVWRNKATGANSVWFMDGLTLSSMAALTTIADLNWELALVADFDGDGRFDLLWRNKATGDNVMWLMNGAVIASSGNIPTVSDTNWKIIQP